MSGNSSCCGLKQLLVSWKRILLQWNYQGSLIKSRFCCSPILFYQHISLTLWILSRCIQNEWAELAKSGSTWIFDKYDHFKFYMWLHQQLIEWNSCQFCYSNMMSNVTQKLLELQFQVILCFTLVQEVCWLRSTVILVAMLSLLCEGDEGKESRHILPLSGDGDVLQLHYYNLCLCWSRGRWWLFQVEEMVKRWFQVRDG